MNYPQGQQDKCHRTTSKVWLPRLDAAPIIWYLLIGIDYFSAGNRNLALDAFWNNGARLSTPLDALEQGKVRIDMLSNEHIIALRNLKKPTLKARSLKSLEQLRKER